ncbi:hypothetical protein VZT92_016250 [Zoarces viviparus]|uniref:Uncharacterized protein n=1 Tax=Zoarces viviparus TaxID=48416 RepID=A0AAW1ETJ6_ZOAVI
MNWVGGSRNRFAVKNDAKKQREFFEKRKMQHKLKNLGLALPASPRGTSSGSMDLVTLFIVNQIAAKKEIKDPPKVAVLGSYKERCTHKRSGPLVLPMSPCSPSQLTLVEGQPQFSAQGQRKRKHVIPQGFKCSQLSPVLESAFSDNSASDYLPPTTDSLSPFSSTSSASSGQGIIPPQQRSQKQAPPPPHCSIPPWDSAVLGQTTFQPFSQPRGMTDLIPWSCGSNPALYHLKTPTAARVLFRSPEPDNTEAWGQARHDVAFSLNQLEDTEPTPEFALNQSDTEQQFEGDVFRGFSAEACEREASHFGRGTSKIYLKEETAAASSAPQTVPDSQCMEVEGSGHIHLSNCTNGSFSCREHDDGPMNGCEYSPGSSCSGGYLSSDSNDDEECCLQAASSHMDQACCADSLHSYMGSQGNPKQRHSKPRPLTPLLNPNRNTGDDQEVMENTVFQVQAFRGNSQQTGSNTPQFAPPLAQTQMPELCACMKTSNETRDAGTQTVDNLDRRDASTQCGVVAVEAAAFNSCPPPVDVSVQHPATGRQTDTAAEPSARTPSSDRWRSGEKHKKQSGSPSGSSFTNKCTDGRATLQRHTNLFLDALSMTDGRGKETREGRDERGQQENGRLTKGLSKEAMEEVTSSTRASNGLQGETATLQEIADILLLLKQRKEVTE